MWALQGVDQLCGPRVSIWTSWSLFYPWFPGSETPLASACFPAQSLGAL